MAPDHEMPDPAAGPVTDEEDRETVPEGEGSSRPLTVDELVRAATRLAMGSAGLAVTTATRWQRASGEGSSSRAASAAGNLASAALGLGLATERVVVRGASTVGSTAASVTWGVMRIGPLRAPIERLAERFRGEQQVSEAEVSDALGALLDAIGEALLARVDLDRVIDRIALERVLARIDRRELERRLGAEQTGPTG